MINAISYVLLPNGGYRCLHQCLMAVLSQTHHLLCSEHPKFLFQLAEDELYRVVIWSIADIENILEPKSLHLI